MDDLTKDAKRLLGLIYKEYLLDIQNGIAKSDAKQLGSSEMIHQKLVPNELFDDVDETMSELGRAKYLANQYGSDVIYDSSLTDQAIIFMETRFKRGIVDVVDFLSKLK